MTQFRAIERIKLMATAAMLISVLFAAASAQKTITKTMTFESEGEMFMLKELGGIIMEAGDTIKVEMVMPPDQRPKEYKDVDIDAGDIIKMANGKKINSVAEFSELYDSLKIGDEIKIGLLRGKRMKMTSFIKGDPEKMPGQMMMVTTDVGEGEDKDIVTGLISAGILLSQQGDRLVVEDIMEQIVVPFDGPAPIDGDVLLSINGQALDNSDKLDDILASVNAGDKVNMILLREGEKISTSFVMPDESTQPMMKRKVIKKGK